MKPYRKGLMTVLTIACVSIACLLGCSKDIAVRYKPDPKSDATIEVDIHGNTQYDTHDLVP